MAATDARSKNLIVQAVYMGQPESTAQRFWMSVASLTANAYHTGWPEGNTLSV